MFGSPWVAHLVWPIPKWPCMGFSLIKFDRLIKSYISLAPKGFQSFVISMIVWLHDKLYLKKNIIKELKKIDKNFIPKNNIKFGEHHFSHASSAFYASPF